VGDVAVRVEGLGKRYRLGANAQPYATFRETLNALGSAPFRLGLRMAGRSPATDARGHRPEFWALKDVSFQVPHGDVTGIIGRNGAGKSTLLKVLSRITEPTRGRVSIRGRVASLLEVGTGFHPELTGRENVFLNGAILGMSRSEIQRKFDEIVAFAEVEKFIDTEVKRYSSGMYLRLAFAVAAHLEPEILIVDEVLAVGDAAFQKKCLGKIGQVSSTGRTVLFVSHNLTALRSLCKTAVLLEQGAVTSVGKAEDVLRDYEIRTLELATAAEDGVVYRCPERLREGAHIIDRVELLDRSKAPIRVLRTWDAVCFRLWYRATETMLHGAVELWVKTIDGSAVIRCSTSPGSNVPVKLLEGEHYIDCLFEQFPLAAGTYLFGVGLTMPNIAYVFKDEGSTTLEVHAVDVFQSGFAPRTREALIASPHSWSIGE
jgi:lipopolysaccharide transport system ATP-binding protein